MTNDKLRAWWSYRQGLDGSLAGQSAAEVFARSGWARSVAGCGPYLTLFARAGLRREQVDAALAAIEIHELPAARGCTYVVAASDYALALSAGREFADQELKVARKLAVTEVEIENLQSAVLKALVAGPLDPDALKTKVGDAARNLGEEGIKKGITTTLPVALGLLQAAGEIRRIPVNGRLDQQRYKYALWRPNPLTKWKKSAEDSYIELARRYFAWIGPATMAEFQGFSGLGAKAAKAAVEPLKLIPAEDDRLLAPEDADSYKSFQVPKRPKYVLVSSLDSINQLRRDLRPLVNEGDRHHRLIGTKTGLADLPHHAILDRGRLAGLWDFDPSTGKIEWISFIPKDRALEEAVEKTQAYIRDDLGDARAFSLDSPARRAPRIEALRKAAAA